MNKKKDNKSKNSDKMTDGAANNSASEAAGETGPQITSKQELKSFLQGIRDKLTENSAAPIYVMSAMNYVMSLPDIYSLLDNENKEIARDIWLRIKQSGLQVRMPALLFNPEEVQGGTSSIS